MFGWRARQREWFERSIEAANLRARVDALEARARYITAERDYWREKAEILLDSTLFHRGEVRNHVFSKPPAQPEADPFVRALAGLAHNEMESAKRPASARE